MNEVAPSDKLHFSGSTKQIVLGLNVCPQIGIELAKQELQGWEEFQQIEDLFHSHIATDSKLNLSTNQN